MSGAVLVMHLFQGMHQTQRFGQDSSEPGFRRGLAGPSTQVTVMVPSCSLAKPLPVHAAGWVQSRCRQGPCMPRQKLGGSFCAASHMCSRVEETADQRISMQRGAAAKHLVVWMLQTDHSTGPDGPEEPKHEGHDHASHEDGEVVD